jgi:ribonuclease P protein component
VKREQRLRTPAEFARTRAAAPRAWTHPTLVLYVAPNELARARVGITVSSRVGNAVVRNRVRRRLRAALTERYPRLPTSHDVLVIARPAAATAPYAELSAALDRLLSRACP